MTAALTPHPTPTTPTTHDDTDDTDDETESEASEPAAVTPPVVPEPTPDIEALRKELEDIMASVARKDLTPYEREKRHRRDMAWRIQTFAARPYIDCQFVT